MNNKAKLDLIRSLKVGDVVIAGNHIGAIRYLGPLEGTDGYNTLNNNIYSVYAGIELTEPNGHMDGSMTINGQSITYFQTPYGDNLNKKRNQTKPKQNALNQDEDVDGKYGLLIPAVSIQKKIDSFALLKKITVVFQRYQYLKHQVNQKEQPFNDIKTNSDLESHSPPTTYNAASHNLMPISQEPIIPNTLSKLTNTKRKNWSLTPMPTSSNNLQKPSADHRYRLGGLALRKMHSDPSHGFVYREAEYQSPQRKLSNLAEDDGEFPSIKLNGNGNDAKKPLNSSLPQPNNPMRIRLIRGYSYDEYNNAMNVFNTKRPVINSRSRTTSYQGIINHDPNHQIKMVLSTDTSISKPSPSPHSHKALITKATDDKGAKDKSELILRNKDSPKSLKSGKSDVTFNSKLGHHHVSASMYTHGPLNVWTDSNRYLSNKLTSSGGAIDKSQDLSSLAINVSSPRQRHVSTRSASYHESPHQQHDSEQLKELLEELKRNKLNDIIIHKHNNNNNDDDDDEDDDEDIDDVPKLMDNNTTAATVHSETADVLGNNYSIRQCASPEEKLAEVENNEDEKQETTTTTQQTPIPSDVELNLITNNHNIFDLNLNGIAMESIDEMEMEMEIKSMNEKKRASLNLTENLLRKHNKRRSKIIFYMNNEHRHQQTLSEPMLPKFNLMIHADSSDDEKSGSSDGDSDGECSLGMDNNLDEDNDHTLDITEDDVQLQLNDENQTQNETEKEDNKDNKSNKSAVLWSIASPISRRSSVNDIDYKPFKTKHDFVRDVTYFNTMHRAQRIDEIYQKLTKQKENETETAETVGTVETVETADTVETAETAETAETETQNINEIMKDDHDILDLDIIKEGKQVHNNNDNNHNGHKTQLSCDTRCAVHESIEPYKPPNNNDATAAVVTSISTSPQSALV